MRTGRLCKLRNVGGWTHCYGFISTVTIWWCLLMGIFSNFTRACKIEAFVILDTVWSLDLLGNEDLGLRGFFDSKSLHSRMTGVPLRTWHWAFFKKRPNILGKGSRALVFDVRGEVGVMIPLWYRVCCRFMVILPEILIFISPPQCLLDFPPILCVE